MGVHFLSNWTTSGYRRVASFCEHGDELYLIHDPCIIRNVQYWYQQMHISILKLVYIYSELLRVSANHVAIFRDIKYRG
jgi:hypothetical protein